MKAVCTFNPPDEIKNNLTEQFKMVDFLFIRKGRFTEADLQDAEIIITFGEDLTDKDIHSAAKLKWIMVTSAGLEKMPWTAIKGRKILVTNAKGIHKGPMAEFTMAYILEHAKQLRAIWKQQQASEWNPRLPLYELKERHLLVVGTGAIGKEIGRLAKAFGMYTSGINSNGRKVDFFDEVFSQGEIMEGLKNADYVVSILPSTDQTIHFYKEKHFKAMKQSAVFINIGRGNAVKESVLLAALRNQEIAHAYLDVFEQEPLPKDHPFWKEEYVTITPHISSHSQHYLPRAFEIFKTNLHTYINNSGPFKNEIDPEKGY